MEKNKLFLRAIRMITKPAKLAHFKLTQSNGISARDKITAILSFVLAVYVLFSNAPYNGLGEILLSCLVSFILAGICVVVVSFCFPFIWKIITLFFFVPAWIYDLCDDSINHVGRKKGNTLRQGAKPKVGIKYFIEREKRIQIDHAKWIGP